MNIIVNGFNVIDAKDDNVSMPNTQYQINIDVLNNDNMAGEVSTVTIQVETDPSHGNAHEITSGGKPVIAYVPDDGFVGKDSFTYRAIIGGVSDVATVTVNAIDATPAENHAPVALNLEKNITNCDIGEKKLFQLVATDEDNGDILTYRLSGAEPEYGELIIKNDGSGMFKINDSMANGNCPEGVPATFKFIATDNHGAVSNEG